MEKKSFFSFRISHLSNDNANSLMKSTVDIAIPVRTKLGDMASAVLDELLPNVSSFGYQVNTQQKSKFTEQVTAMDKKNDGLLAEIKRTVVFMSKSRDAAKVSAAQTVDFFLTPYWNVSKKPIKTQADDLVDMFAKFHADPELVAAATEIGVAALLTELETSNSDLVTVYLTRNEEIGNRGASGSDLRPAAETSYNQFCNVIEQAVNYTPNDALIALFNSMDALRRKYSVLASDGKTPPADEAKA